MLVALALTCAAIDGDTLRCGHERIRLLGIDAPEMPGHCRVGRDCAPGDPFASRDALAASLKAGPRTIKRLHRDRYGRTIAEVYVAGESLSCSQVAGGFARYWPPYDEGGRIARECGARR